MNRILSYAEGRSRQRRVACLKKARTRIRHAAGYLGKLLAEFETAGERKRQILAHDVEGLLQEALQLVRKGRKARPRRKRSP